MPLIEDTSYSAPYLVANSHVATLVPNFLRFTTGVKYTRERIHTEDGDFLDLDWSVVGSKKAVIFSHGLEGHSRKAYVLGMVKHFNKIGWDACAWNFRSCSGEPNWTVPFYHPGQTHDMDLVVRHVLEKGGYDSVALVGFSLGGAYILRYLGEHADNLPAELKRAVVFSVPTDLSACAKHLSNGTMTWYGRAFLNLYKKKMVVKEKLNPGRYDLRLWDKVTTLKAFDEVFNTMWYGCNSVEDFYHMASPNVVIDRINIPTLVVNAANDPFLPPSCYPKEAAHENENVFLEIPESGGHVGFMTLKWRGIFWSETRTEAFLEDLG